MQILQGIIQTLGFFEESDHSNEKPIARRVTRVLVMKVSFEIQQPPSPIWFLIYPRTNREA